MTRTITAAAAAATLAALTACGVAMRAGADYDPDTSFAGYETFTWAPPDALPTGDPRLDDNPFFIERVEAAVEGELEARGIRHAQGSGELLVHFHVSVRDRTEVLEADRRYGYEGGGYPGETRVIQYEEGTLLVDIAEREGRDIIWRGWAQLDLGGLIGDPERMAERVREAIRRMFEGFPAQ